MNAPYFPVVAAVSNSYAIGDGAVIALRLVREARIDALEICARDGSTATALKTTMTATQKKPDGRMDTPRVSLSHRFRAERQDAAAGR
ncbi:MAG: hypothetical protein ABSG03_03900 [Bryobacteraceae bacterium]